MMDKEQVTKEVAEWWNNHPFTFGLAPGVAGRDLVGKIDFNKMNLNYFEDIERKFRKHSGDGGQQEGAPLLSNLIDYQWLKGKKVLDIGIGSGFTMVAFIQGGTEVTGIDITNFAVEEAKKNLAVRHLPGTILQMDAQEMIFSDNSFDFINVWGCLMYMPDAKKAIREMYRVLNPGGRILVYLYNKNSWSFWFNTIFLRGILLGQLLKYRFNIDALTSRFSDGGGCFGGNPFTHYYTPREAARLFLNARFVTVESLPWERSHEADNWPMRYVRIFRYFPARVKRWMSRHWGFGLIVRAQKQAV